LPDKNDDEDNLKPKELDLNLQSILSDRNTSRALGDFLEYMVIMVSQVLFRVEIKSGLWPFPKKKFSKKRHNMI
jgi:hypothetical protein